MQIFRRGWLPHTPPMNFTPLTIGVSFLVNIGYAGPIAGDARPGRMTCTDLHAWPPISATASTPRRHLLRAVLTAASASIGDHLLGLAARPDDSLFLETIRSKDEEPVAANGHCIEPAITTGDAITETDGPIQVGDLVLVQLRGTLQPIIKVFAGFMERYGERKALFYLKTPEQVIEAYPSDILYARRVEPVREITGHDLLEAADPFMANLRAEYGVLGDLDPIGESRKEAWIESVLAVLARLREAPE